MAFEARDLSVIAYANGFTLWHYTTPDPHLALCDGKYFDDAADMLRRGDIIVANTDTDGALVSGCFTVASNDGSTVGIKQVA